MPAVRCPCPPCCHASTASPVLDDHQKIWAAAAAADDDAAAMVHANHVRQLLRDGGRIVLPAIGAAVQNA